VSSTKVDISGLHLCGHRESYHYKLLATRVVVPNDAIDDLCHGYAFNLCFGFDLLDKGFFNVQRPTLSRSRGFIRGAEQMFPFSPPGKNFLKISEIGEGYINVDICGSTFVDFSGATVVDIGGLYRKCSF
jgi:hypothetical protein